MNTTRYQEFGGPPSARLDGTGRDAGRLPTVGSIAADAERSSLSEDSLATGPA
jgi:hypothetical protein